MFSSHSASSRSQKSDAVAGVSGAVVIVFIIAGTVIMVVVILKYRRGTVFGMKMYVFLKYTLCMN